MRENPDSELLWLQRWYENQCNGDWEHQHGITIETIDNPGWAFRVSLIGTPLQAAQGYEEKEDRGEKDWVVVRVVAGEFHAFGDPTKLVTIIQRFRQFVEAETRRCLS